MLTQCLGSQVAPVAARFARAHRTASARARPSAWVLKSRPWQLASLVLIEPLAHVRGGGCISVKSRRVAARDNSRQWAAAERRACASRWNATAPEAGAGLFPDFRGRKLAGHGAERCEVKRCGIQAANVSMAAVPAPGRPLSENRPGPCLRTAPGMTTALALFFRLCRLRP